MDQVLLHRAGYHSAARGGVGGCRLASPRGHVRPPAVLDSDDVPALSFPKLGVLCADVWEGGFKCDKGKKIYLHKDFFSILRSVNNQLVIRVISFSFLSFVILIELLICVYSALDRYKL